MDFLTILNLKFLFQILSAIFCGGLLGYERQRFAKPVGILTSILVTLGSSLFVTASTLITQDSLATGDFTRIPAMIVSGIGFIGAGAIMRSKFNVTGLASAATIWTLGAVGMLIGWGHIPVALGFTVVIFILLRLIPKLEHILFKQQFCLHMDLTLKKNRIDQLLEFFLENQISLSSTRISSKGDRAVVSIHQCGVDNKAKVLNSLRQIKGIFSISGHPVT